MNNTDLIRELRAITSAGMKDCKDALEETGGDLQKAVDVIKTKGLNIANGLSGRAASEGMVVVADGLTFQAMVEVNSQTDFTANSPDFRKFAALVALDLVAATLNKTPFQHDNETLESSRQRLVSATKENIVIRRWWVEEALAPNARVFSYVHSNDKIGVLLTLLAPSVEALNSQEFRDLGDNLTMQVAAMSPLAVSPERLTPEEIERQKAIFEAQLTEMNKPQAAWPKILEGKFRKWHSEVCLLEQEAVWLSKITVKQAVEEVSKALGGDIKVINFARCQVGT